MKIDFSAKIRGLDGKTVKDGEKVELTLATVATTALLATHQGEQNIGGDEKVRRFKLAEIAYAGGIQNVETKDAATLKELIAKAFSPLVVGRAFELIEGEKERPMKVVK